MRKLLLLMGCGWLAMAASAQIITTQPAIIQTDSKNIVITYHANEGNMGLMGESASSAIYAHTGVITNESTSSGDWKHAPTWLDNSSKYKLTYISDNTWSLSIPSIDTYYDLTAGETVEQLMFVFRNATGSKEGKTANGGDIAVPVYPSGFQVVLSSSLESSVINSFDAVQFTVNTTSAANIRLYVEGSESTPIATASNATTLTGSRAFTAVGSYNIVAEATTASGTVKKSTLQLVKLGESTQQAYPGGVPKMGPVRNADGSVTFCIAAPGKQSMVLVPSWNGYKVSADGQMKYQDYQGHRYFWTTVSNLAADTDYFYYFLADGTTAVGDPYARLILDPWSDKYISSDVFPNLPVYPTGSVPEGLPLAVYNSNADTYSWQVKNFTGVDADQLIIYELLIRDFTGTEGEANGSGTIAGVLEKLDYLKNLGVNAIELMPIMEFNGNNSWGYNTNFYFAPDKAYGTPNDYRRLIDECHARGMAVILDIVFNQSDGLHPWYQMYPISENPFYNASAPHAYSVLNDWKQENPLVEQQWIDAVKYWLTAYNVDGFRFDLVKGLGDSDSYGATYTASTNAWSGVTDDNTNKYNQSRIDRMKRIHAAIKEVKPNAYFINEDLATAEEENALAADGQLNWANLNNPSTLFCQAQFTDNTDLRRFYAPLDGSRTWGSTVSYIESHDEERVAYVLANSSSTNSTIQRSEEYQMRRLATNAAIMLMTPGAHMIWQFEEFGADQTTKDSSGNDTSPKTIVWSYLDNEYHAGLHTSYTELCGIRSSNRDLFTKDATVVDNMFFQTRTSQTLKITNGNKELILVVNPNYLNTSSTITVPATFDASGYKLLSASYGQSPALSASKTVALRGGCYAVFGTNNLTAGIDDIAADHTESNPVTVDADGSIHVSGDYRSLTVHDITGRIVPSQSLPSGIYIVNVDGRSYKIAVAR